MQVCNSLTPARISLLQAGNAHAPARISLLQAVNSPVPARISLKQASNSPAPARIRSSKSSIRPLPRVFAQPRGKSAHAGFRPPSNVIDYLAARLYSCLTYVACLVVLAVGLDSSHVCFDIERFHSSFR